MCVRGSEGGCTEFDRVAPELLLELQPQLQTLAGIFVLQHLRLLELREIEVALIPELVAGEFVVGRQKGMRLSITLYLRYLVDGFESCACLGIFACQAAPVQI